jgi:N-methylhydantoinase A
VTREGEEPRVFKVLSTPKDPSIGLINGLAEIAACLGRSLNHLGSSIDTIVHGTTVTTNSVLTSTGAKTGLITTEGVRDALEMRRGGREEQYNNRYTNVPPLVPRYLRLPVAGRLNHAGEVVRSLDLDDVRAAIDLLRREKVEAVAICFMNSFANPEHEREAARLVQRELPDAYLTVSTGLLPSIRFYDRVSTTVLNSYVGPKLSSYVDSLTSRLQEVGFGGILLIMQSNGGVMSPEVARSHAALTLLSGPEGGPRAVLVYAGIHGHTSCITVDMGGTSFDAALVRDGAPIVVTEGEINRYRIALPMLGIVTIGAGGGSVGWIDEGGLLRIGPQSAGADPGPACYGRGGTLPTCTDADLVLGYLDPDFFAGGKIRLDKEAALTAVTDQIAKPLRLSTVKAAAGMYRVINTNMAQGVREITVKRGHDPREFPMVVAGGAGPLHACMICHELEIPLFLVPRESSIFCAAGMLMSDLQHDFVRSFVSRLDQIDTMRLKELIHAMMTEGRGLLAKEKIGEERWRFMLSYDCRYVKQYHEVSFPMPLDAVEEGNLAGIAESFHTEHNRMYGYSLEKEGTPVELINVRLRAVGITEKPAFAEEEYAGGDASTALKGRREVYLPEEEGTGTVPIFDGHKTRFGHRITGPALVEQINTTLLLTSNYDCLCDKHGTFVVYLKERRDLADGALEDAGSRAPRSRAGGRILSGEARS